MNSARLFGPAIVSMRSATPKGSLTGIGLTFSSGLPGPLVSTFFKIMLQKAVSLIDIISGIAYKSNIEERSKQMSLMNSYGFIPNFNIFEVAGAYDAFLDAAIAIDDNDRPALHKAYIAALRAEEAYIKANTAWVRCGFAEVEKLPPHMNLVDWIMENTVAVIRTTNLLVAA